MHEKVNKKRNRLLVIKQRYLKEERMGVASIKELSQTNEKDVVSHKGYRACLHICYSCVSTQLLHDARRIYFNPV